MKIKELRELSNEELGKRGKELRHELLTSRLQQTTGQLENPMRLRAIRREVAKIETLLSERRIQASTTAAK